MFVLTLIHNDVFPCAFYNFPLFSHIQFDFICENIVRPGLKMDFTRKYLQLVLPDPENIIIPELLYIDVSGDSQTVNVVQI